MTTTIDQFFYLIPKLTNHGALSPACGRGLPLIYQLRKKAGRFHVLQFLLLSIVRKQKTQTEKRVIMQMTIMRKRDRFP